MSSVSRAVVTLLAIPSVPAGGDLAVLTGAERERAARFRQVADVARFVTARAALRRIVAGQLDMDPRSVPLVADHRGRLGLANAGTTPASASLDFNVSHSGQMAAVAIVHGARVGVDLEWHLGSRQLEEIEASVMTAAERHMLRTLDGASYVRAFLDCWTRKEAIVKAIGIGLGYDVTTIDVPTLPPNGMVRLTPDALDTWTVMTTHPDADYSLSVAVSGEAETVIDSAAWDTSRTHDVRREADDG